MHYLDVRHAARTMTDAAGLVVRGLELGIVRPSASLLTVVLPPFCSMCDWVEASTWQDEHTVIVAEVAIGSPGVAWVRHLRGKSGEERRGLHHRGVHGVIA